MGSRVARWHVELLVLTVVWGLNFAWIEVAIESFTPVQIAFGRLVIGGVLVSAVAAALRVPWPRSVAAWWHLTVAGVLTAALPCTLVPVAQQSVTSVTAGMVNASAPLFAAVLGAVLMGLGWAGGDHLVRRSAVPGLSSASSAWCCSSGRGTVGTRRSVSCMRSRRQPRTGSGRSTCAVS